MIQKYSLENFNPKHEKQYFAILVFTTKANPNKENSRKLPLFIREDENGTEIINFPQNTQICFLPNTDKEQRDLIYASGKAGSGKSFLANKFCQLHKKLYPDKDIYFITTNDFYADKSLTHELYKPIDFGGFVKAVQNDPEGVAKGKHFNNCLMVFDDIGGSQASPDAEKWLWYCVNMISENLRKKNVSMYLITHNPTNYKQTSLIIKELNHYIVYPQTLQVHSDRLLNHYLGLKKDHIRKILSTNSRFCVIDCKRKLCLTENGLFPLKFD